jgi:hypothetical protein
VTVVTKLWPSSSDHAALGSGEFTNPLNVSVDDSATFATKTNPTTNTFGDKYGTWGLGIPAGATITQVQLKYQVKSTNTVTGRVFWNVAAATGSNHDVTPTTSLVVNTYDVTAERAWVAADFGDGTFFVSLEVIGVSGSGTTSFNALYVIVTFTPAVAGITAPAGLPLIYLRRNR